MHQTVAGDIALAGIDLQAIALEQQRRANARNTWPLVGIFEIDIACFDIDAKLASLALVPRKIIQWPAQHHQRTIGNPGLEAGSEPFACILADAQRNVAPHSVGTPLQQLGMQIGHPCAAGAAGITTAEIGAGIGAVDAHRIQIDLPVVAAPLPAEARIQRAQRQWLDEYSRQQHGTVTAIETQHPALAAHGNVAAQIAHAGDAAHRQQIQFAEIAGQVETACIAVRPQPFKAKLLQLSGRRHAGQIPM